MTSEPTEEKQSSRPWQWPGEWMKDEKFWKDVASRTISGVFAVGVVYVYGLAVGYFKTPVIIGTTLAAIGASGFVLLFIALGIFIYRVGFKRITGHEKFLRTFERFLMISGAIVVIGTFLLGLGGSFDGMTLFDDFLSL